MAWKKYELPWWCYWLLARFQWFRRWHGGHWELWWNDVTRTDMWFHVDQCSGRGISQHYRPPCCMGNPLCENWTKEKP